MEGEQEPQPAQPPPPLPQPPPPLPPRPPPPPPKPKPQQSQADHEQQQQQERQQQQQQQQQQVPAQPQRHSPLQHQELAQEEEQPLGGQEQRNPPQQPNAPIASPEDEEDLMVNDHKRKYILTNCPTHVPLDPYFSTLSTTTTGRSSLSTRSTNSLTKESGGKRRCSNYNPCKKSFTNSYIIFSKQRMKTQIISRAFEDPPSRRKARQHAVVTYQESWQLYFLSTFLL